MAERALACCELEGVRDLVVEVADCQGVAAAFLGCRVGLLFGVIEQAAPVRLTMLLGRVSDLQFLAGIHGCGIYQDVRSNSSRTESSDSVNDIRP
jgi:hypothetical protein